VTIALAGTITTLYRMYDEAGTLLYVGISNRPLDRKGQHKHDKPWWTEVATMTLEHYPTRQAAAHAEAIAIAGEAPRYNKAGTPDFEQARHAPRARLVAEAPVIARLFSHPEPDTRHRPTGLLMGLQEIEKKLGVSRQRVHQLTDHPNFPPAYDVIKAGRIWRTEDIEGRMRRTGRTPAKEGSQ
jgi:hypothetical protein